MSLGPTLTLSRERTTIVSTMGLSAQSMNKSLSLVGTASKTSETKMRCRAASTRKNQTRTGGTSLVQRGLAILTAVMSKVKHTSSWRSLRWSPLLSTWSTKLPKAMCRLSRVQTESKSCPLAATNFEDRTRNETCLLIRTMRRVKFRKKVERS